MGLSLNSKSADQKTKVVIPEDAKVVLPPFQKNLVPSNRHKKKQGMIAIYVRNLVAHILLM